MPSSHENRKSQILTSAFAFELDPILIVVKQRYFIYLIQSVDTWSSIAALMDFSQILQNQISIYSTLDSPKFRSSHP